MDFYIKFSLSIGEWVFFYFSTSNFPMSPSRRYRWSSKTRGRPRWYCCVLQLGHQQSTLLAICTLDSKRSAIRTAPTNIHCLNSLFVKRER